MRASRWIVVAALLLVWLTPRTADAHVGWWDWLDAFSGPGPFDQKSYEFDIRFYCGFDSDNQFVVPRNPTEAMTNPNESTEANRDSDRAAVSGLLGTEWVPLAGRRHVRDFVRVAPSGTTPAKYTLSHSAGDAKTAPLACFRYSDVADRWIEMRYGQVSTAPKALFDDAPNEFVGKLTAHSLQWSLMRRVDPVLAVGGGAGVLWFSGTTADGKAPMLTGHAARAFVTPVSVVFSPLKVLPASRFSSHLAQSLLGVPTVRLELVLVGGSRASDFNRKSSSSFHSGRELLTNIGFAFDFTPLINKIKPVKVE